MNTPARVALGVLAAAVVVLFGQRVVTGPFGRRLDLVTAKVCAGIPAPKAPRYDTARAGIHKLAEAGRRPGTWPLWDSTTVGRWYAQQLAESELALCFASESVVVNTCRGYGVPWGPVRLTASDVVIAVRRWSLRLVETRTGRVVDTLRLESPGTCPDRVAEHDTFEFYEGDTPERTAVLRAWVARSVVRGAPAHPPGAP
jgi:hypothetical protein